MSKTLIKNRLIFYEYDAGQNHDKGMTVPTVFSKMSLGLWHATCAGEARGVTAPDE
jgi:hypothetical protein